MRASLSWLVELVPALADHSPAQVADLLTGAGVEVDEIVGMTPSDINGLIIGEVLEIEELAEFKKPIRYCQVRVGADEIRGIVCGARNFAVGDRVVVALPGALLPGDFKIAARKTYGHVSDGMICSAAEMGLGDDHDGIMILPADAPIGVDPAEMLGLYDVVLVTEPTPDRGYQLSMRGLARELAAVLRVDFTDPAAAVPEATAGEFQIQLDDETGCGRFSARVMRGFDPASVSPDWMQSRLRQSGMRPISLAVDVTNYVMLALGQPMHAYDLAKLSGRIVVRRANPGEKVTTLDDVQRTLDVDDLLITDDERIQGIAGVMGAAYGEISADTTDILLEAAYFDPTTISRSVRRHSLLSEAGRRFERGVDPALGPVAVALASQLLATYGGAVAEAGLTSVGTPKPLPAVRVSANSIRHLVGADYALGQITDLLHRTGAHVEPGEPLIVTPPSWRPDLVEMPDFAEEVARLDGYENIPSVLPHAPAGGGLTSAQRRRRQVARALAHAGYVETPSMSFQDSVVLDAMRLTADDPRRGLVRLANPLSSEQAYLRSSLLPGLLSTLQRNVGRGFEDLALSEIGTIFREPKPGTQRPAAPVLPGDRKPTPEQFEALDAALPFEATYVAVALCGQTEPSGWWGAGQPGGWQEAVAATRLIAAEAGAAVEVTPADQAPWHPGRCAQIALADGTVLGYAGELHPAVCEALGLPRRTSAAELDLSATLAAQQAIQSAPVISDFPAAVQDIALIVDHGVLAAQVESALWSGGGELLEDIALFDLYAGSQIGEGKKSLAYRLRFRAPDRTLTTEEVSAARENAVGKAAEAVGAVLRG